jgi:glycosyltransferase involved in cell wall biosynthesis
LNQKPLTFGSIMRFSAEKAPGDFIEAFVRLSNALPQVPIRLVIAGDGELFDKAQRQVEASGLGEKISLLGWRTDIKEVLRKLDVFVVSSFCEAGLSYSTMEAMAAKLPIISTNVFGLKEALSQVPGNIVIPAGDPGALANGMRQMATLTDPKSLRQSLQKIGQANHDYVWAHFKQSENTRRTLRVYKELQPPNSREP